MVNVTRISVQEPYAQDEDLLGFLLPRANPTVPPVSCHIIPDVAVLDQKKDLLDYRVISKHFLQEGRLSHNQAVKLITDAKRIIEKEPNVVNIGRKCYVFGDIHGQFYDIHSVIDKFNFRRNTLVFVGDYVDRGQFSTETYFYLLLLKSHFPENIVLLRGNHETEKMTRYFTFRSECLKKYNEEIYNLSLESFKSLPLAAVIQGKAFCVHGGISPSLKKVSDIDEIYRAQEPVYSGLMCDLLWSDPHPYYGSGSDRSWERNEKRRCSYLYSYNDVVSFLEANSLSTIIRGHEVQKEGYTIFKEHNGNPSVISIFSAPNYCDFYGNLGAVVEFDRGIKSIFQFSAVTHPFVLHGASNGFIWSLPLVADKLIDLAKALFDVAASTALPLQISSPEASEPVCPDTPSLYALAKSVAEMRLEQEMASEVETVCDCTNDSLGLPFPQVSGFEDALDKDSVNESVKEAEEPALPDLSPSERFIGSKEIGELRAEDLGRGKKDHKKLFSWMKFW